MGAPEAVAALPTPEADNQDPKAGVARVVRAQVAATPQSPAAAAHQAGVPSRVAVDEAFRPLGDELDRLGDEAAKALCNP